MESVEIIATDKYLPKRCITNKSIEKKFDLSSNWISTRTGINQRFYSDEDISMLAIKAVENLIMNSKIDIQKVDLIIVATTSTKKIMPGISFIVQKAFNIQKCRCIDVLAGCSGYINAFDIARKYIITEDCNCALVIGVEKLSEFILIIDEIQKIKVIKLWLKKF